MVLSLSCTDFYRLDHLNTHLPPPFLMAKLPTVSCKLACCLNSFITISYNIVCYLRSWSLNGVILIGIDLLHISYSIIFLIWFGIYTTNPKPVYSPSPQYENEPKFHTVFFSEHFIGFQKKWMKQK